MSDIDEEWSNFLSNIDNNFTPVSIDTEKDKVNTPPPCEDLYISTKTKALFLNQPIDIQSVFWKIPVVEYWKQQEGVIKKQMKVISKSQEEYESLQELLKNEYYYTENIIKQINNPEARRIKFKDERKITVGISKKDILNSRGKIKNAFYNCFAIIMRFYLNDSFREIHVKVFNTGKMEIPGVVDDKTLDIIKSMVIRLLHNVVSSEVEFINKDVDSNVLINSNFNCGFCINRDILYTVLKNGYGIDTSFDPCSYPGVKCKFYFNNDIGFNSKLQNGKISEGCDRDMKMSELNNNKKYTEVSFMVFRTGSCLIIGNCSEEILMFIYNFIKTVLQKEYNRICIMNEVAQVKIKAPKIRKKIISVTQKDVDELDDALNALSL